MTYVSSLTSISLTLSSRCCCCLLFLSLTHPSFLRLPLSLIRTFSLTSFQRHCHISSSADGSYSKGYHHVSFIFFKKNHLNHGITTLHLINLTTFSTYATECALKLLFVLIYIILLYTVITHGQWWANKFINLPWLSETLLVMFTFTTSSHTLNQRWFVHFIAILKLIEYTLEDLEETFYIYQLGQINHDDFTTCGRVSCWLPQTIIQSVWIVWLLYLSLPTCFNNWLYSHCSSLNKVLNNSIKSWVKFAKTLKTKLNFQDDRRISQ